MGSFVTGNTALPAPKLDLYPATGSSFELDASDINNLWSAAGDLRDQVRGWVNVKSSAYGAKGDGLTDDTAAIQAAINAATAAGGGVVFVPPGTYRVKDLALRDNVCLRGAGHASILKLPDSTPQFHNVINLGQSYGFSASNVEVSDLKVDGNAAQIGLSNVQMHGIAITSNSTNVRVRNVWIDNTCGDGVWCVKDGGGTSPQYVGLHENYITRSGRQSISYLAGQFFAITGNRCTGNIDLEPVGAGDISQSTVAGNVCSALNVTNVGATRTVISVTGNHCQSSTIWNVGSVAFAGNDVFGLLSLSQVQDVSVTGNSLKALSISPPNGTTNNRVTVTGNTIINENGGVSDPIINVASKTATVYIFRTNRLLFSDNVVVSPTQHGVYIDTTSTKIRVEGNRIYDPDGTAAVSGVRHQTFTDASQIDVVNNTIDGFRTGISSSGSGNTAGGRVSGNTISGTVTNTVNLQSWDNLTFDANLLIGNVVASISFGTGTVAKQNIFQTTSNVSQLLTISNCTSPRIEDNQFLNDGDAQTILVFNSTGSFVRNKVSTTPNVTVSGTSTLVPSSDFGSPLGFATTATAAGTTTLVAGSAQIQQFTGGTTQTVKMPPATTLAKGTAYTLINRSSGSLTVQDNSAGALSTMTAGAVSTFMVTNASTAAGTWDIR